MTDCSDGSEASGELAQANSPGYMQPSYLMSFDGSRPLIAQRNTSSGNSRRRESNLARVEEPLRTSLTSNEIEVSK